MFKKHLNHKETTRFAKVFHPFFKFEKFKESRDQEDDGKTRYVAEGTINDWDLNIFFDNRINNGFHNKPFYPEIFFLSNIMWPISKVKKESKKVIEYISDKYNPDYNQATKIVEIFVEKGMQSGLFHSVEKKRHIKKMSTYCALSSDSYSLEFKDKNIAMVSFTNILQKRTSKNPDCLKKSYINVKLIHLVQHDDTLQPYFLIKLPYTANKKIVCVVPLKDIEKVYYAGTENPFKTGYLARLNSINMNDLDLEDFFEKLFKTEAKNIITETLDMHSSELYELTVEELRNYLKIAEMVKV